MKIFLISLFSLLAIGFLLANCSTFGQLPKGEALIKISDSPNYDLKRGQFVNVQQDRLDKMKEEMDLWKTSKEFFSSNGVEKVPKERLPEVKPDMKAFVEPSDELKVLWFGHSTFLLNMAGQIILVDPVFSDSASPISFLVKRFQKPVIELEELPHVDTIVISHDHYDHLDMNTVKFFAQKTTNFITPLGVGEHLKSWGIGAERITELDWWQETQVSEVKFIATPAQHFSGRGLVKQNHTLWASWVIQSESQNIYFSGDSGYDSHFKDIGEKYGPFDLAFIENGQYNLRWEAVHLLPEQSAQAYFDLKAKRYLPVHWGMFELSLHSWYEPIERIVALGESQGINVVAPRFGEVVKINDDLKTDKWWKSFIPKNVGI